MASTASSPAFVPALDPNERDAAKRIILLTVFLDILGFGIVIPQLGIYASQFGSSALAVGVLASTYSAMAFLFTPFWGRLSDRVGRRPVLIYSIFGTAVGYIVFAFANSMPMLFLSRFVDGVTGGNISVAQAYLSDITPPEERAKNFGLFGAIFGVGFAIGPMIGWGLSHLPGAWGGNFGIGIATAALGFLNWFLAIRRLPETLSSDVRRANRERDAGLRGLAASPLAIDGFRRAFKMPGLNVVITASFLATVAFATLQGTFTLFLIREYVRPEVQQSIAANPRAAIAQAQAHLSAPKASLPIVAGEGGESAPTVPENAAKGGEVQTAKPYAPDMGGDFNPQTVRGVAPPKGLSWRRIEQLLVQPLAARDAGLIFFCIGAVALVIMGRAIEPLKKRFGERRMIVTGTLIMAIGLLLVPFPSRVLPGAFWAQFPVMILLAFGNSIATPVLSSLASQFAPEAERGEILGVFQSMGSLGRIIGPIMGNFVFQFAGSSFPYWLGAFVMLFAFAATLRLKMRGAEVAA